MLPDTLVALIWTLEKSWSCCAIAVCPKVSAAPISEKAIPVRLCLLISLLLSNARGILSLWSVTCDPQQDRLRSERKDGKVNSPLLGLFGPGGSNAVHAGIGDELAHVLVGMNDDAQIHAVDGGVAIGNVDFAFEVFGR